MGLIWLTIIVGYFVMCLVGFRFIVVKQLDNPSFGDSSYQHRRDEVLWDNFWTIVIGSLFWFLVIPAWWLWKFVFYPLWARPTPGEKKATEEKLKRAEERARDEH